MIKKIDFGEKGELAIWQCTEDADFFIHQLDLTKDELEQLEEYSKKKQMEWLSSRYLIHLMSGRDDRLLIKKDDFGKPFLDKSDWFISLSHSSDMATVIASPIPVGIDIQIITPKIERISKKFMRPNEFEMLDEENRLEHLHVFWGAKESLYKIYGRKKVDFREHLMVNAPMYHSSHLHFSGEMKKGGFHGRYQLYSQKVNDFILVYAFENE